MAAALRRPDQNPKFYAFRQRAALFGYNALQTILIDQTHLTSITALLNSDKSDWDFTNSQSSANKELYKSQLIDLDGVYSKIVPHGWIALIVPDAQNTRSPAGLVTLYRVNSITTISRSDFGIGSKLSRIAADLGGTNLQNSYIATRATSALVQSEQLAVPEQPLNYPLYGTFLELQGLRPDLAAVTAVALTGKSQKVAVADGVTKLSILPGGDATKATPLNPGDVLTLIDPTAAAAQCGRLDHDSRMGARWPCADAICRGRERPAGNGNRAVERFRFDPR